MRVLHVIPSLAAVRGGPSRVVRLMAESLAAEGVETEVATTDDDGQGRLGLPAGCVEWNRGVACRYFRRDTRFYTASATLTGWLAREIDTFDVVHIHSLFNYPALVAALLAHWRGVPYIVRPLGVLNRWGLTTRRPLLKRLSLRLVESRILAGAAAIQYATDMEAAETGDGIARDTRAVVIPDPCPPEVAARRPSPEPSILFLSRLDPTKGLDLLIGAFASLRPRFPGLKLVIAGDGERRYTARLRELAERSGAAAGIVWAGFLRGRAKLAAFEQATVFALPSHSESFGMAVVEAMGAGVPAVISDRTGVAAAALKAGCALVTPCNQSELAAGLCRLLEDPRLRDQMSTRGPAFVNSNYSPREVAARLIDIYREVCTTDNAIRIPRKAPAGTDARVWQEG